MNEYYYIIINVINKRVKISKTLQNMFWHELENMEWSSSRLRVKFVGKQEGLENVY